MNIIEGISNFFNKEDKGKTPYPVLKNEPQIHVQDKWCEKKDITVSDMIAQYKSWSFVCARLNAETVASAKLRLYVKTKRGQGKVKNFDTRVVSNSEFKSLSKALKTSAIEQIEEVYDHPALNLLYQVNDFSNYFDNMQLTQTYMDLAGNAYWYLVKDAYGTPIQIYQMRPDMTEVVPAQQKLIKGYLYGAKEKTAMKIDEVIRFHVPNPASAYYGQSCIAAGQAEVSRNNLYNVYENSNLQNNARPDFAVKYDGTLTQADMKRLSAEWNRLYSGPKNNNKIKIMDQNFSIEKISFAPKDMEYLQGRIMTKKDIAAIFGVPYGLLDTSDQLKAGLDNVLVYYQRFAIKPRLRRIEETLTEKLLPMFDADLFFAFDDIVDESNEFKLKQNVEYVNAGIISRNEARATEGYEAVAGGDNLKIESTETNVEESDKQDNKEDI